MNHQLDQIFKKHLAENDIQPSADAWEKLSASINKRKDQKKKNWIAVAASLLMVCVSSYIIFLQEYSKDEILVKTVAMTEVNKKDLPYKPAPAQHTAVISEKETTAVPPKQIKVVPKAKVPNTTELPKPIIHKGVIIEFPDKVENLQADLSIEYTFEKGMKKIPTVETNVSENEKNSLLGRIANTALELKNSDGLMGDIRQLKDELVSLKFFKTKKSI